MSTPDEHTDAVLKALWDSAPERLTEHGTTPVPPNYHLGTLPDDAPAFDSAEVAAWRPSVDTQADDKATDAL